PNHSNDSSSKLPAPPHHTGPSSAVGSDKSLVSGSAASHVEREPGSECCFPRHDERRHVRDLVERPAAFHRNLVSHVLHLRFRHRVDHRSLNHSGSESINRDATLRIFFPLYLRHAAH